MYVLRTIALLTIVFFSFCEQPALGIFEDCEQSITLITRAALSLLIRRLLLGKIEKYSSIELIG